MAATEQEMMERAARIQTIEELREVSAELGLELSPEKEAAFMAVRTAEASSPSNSWMRPSAGPIMSCPRLTCATSRHRRRSVAPPASTVSSIGRITIAW